jgi:hypothetical protein
VLIFVALKVNNQVLNKFMYSYNDLIAKENDLLKLEVKRLELEMVKLQGKALRQSTQDNRDHMVNKLESGTTVSRSLSTKM